jgi:protein-disulfide isomerase
VPTPAIQPKGFTGRYRQGPERAPIRVVMFTDYQCPDCKNNEGLMRTILKQRQDVSLSVKQFPFCTDCNKTPGVPNFHANACWAARAAETAGMLYGNDGFWKMHDWLFDHGGAFTAETLNPALEQMGFDRAQFVAVMQSPEPLKAITADINEAVALGIQRTPMIFINGIELKNWNVDPDALPKGVADLAAANPPAAGPETDRPMSASDKYFDDWRDPLNKAMAWPSRKQPWSSADPNAKVKIQIFGDFLEPGTAEADKTVRDAIAGRSDVRYEFRYFPIDPSCNSEASKFVTKFPGSCRAACVAEAAGQVGGIDAYWRMHEWLMTHQDQVKAQGDAALKAGLQECQLDPDAVLAKAGDPEVVKIIADDVNYGYRIKMAGIPDIFVNGKHVPRWKLPGGFVLERIIEEAAKPDPPK